MEVVVLIVEVLLALGNVLGPEMSTLSITELIKGLKKRKEILMPKIMNPDDHGDQSDWIPKKF